MKLTESGHTLTQSASKQPAAARPRPGAGLVALLAAALRSVKKSGLALLAIALVLSGAACASNKAGMSSPELPAKHWLDDAPGIPIENKEQYDAAVPNLYNPDKYFTFEDCVYLTIQQAPSLVNSAVDIEIQRLKETSATWKYVPEPRMAVRISQNLTNYNKDNHYTYDDYGQTAFDISFSATLPNPMATYFEIRVQNLLTGVAISTHRKAVSEAIYKIAEAYLRLQAQQYSLAAQRSLVPVAKELTEYWKQVEIVEGNQGSSVSLALQHEREAELALEKAEMEETIQRTNLKVLAGIDPDQPFKVDVSHADDILKGFDGYREKWDERWVESEDNLILRTQIKLADYKILIAWAQYVPDMRLNVNTSPPRGQSQPANGSTDYFFHFTFEFPLIDWGRRYRDVQVARMGKAQAFHSMAEQRFNFQNQWILSEQNTSLALTNLKLAQNRYKTAQMQYDEARIAFENGLEVLPEVAQRQEAMVRAQIDYINTELDYRLTKLQWMYHSGILAKRFLGMPDQELDKVVGGNKLLGVGTSGPLSPADPDSEEVFPMDTNTPGADSRRPIGRVRPKVNGLPGIGEDVKARPAAAAPGKSADTDTGTGSPASADGQKPAAGPATDAKARPAASEPASAASNDLTAVPTLADN